MFCETIFAIFRKSSVILCLHNLIASVCREWLFELVYKLNDKGKTRYLFQTTLKRYVTITFSFDLIFLNFLCYTTLQSLFSNVGIVLKKIYGYTIKLRQNYIFYISYIICCLLVKSHCRDYLEATHFRIHVFTLLPRPSVLDD